MRRALALLVFLAAPATARAGGLSLDLVSPRSVGRAGAAVVSDDGAAAVLVNPAGLARRDARRAQLALVVIDDAASYRAASPVAGTPDIDERGASSLEPMVGAQAPLGPVVLGVALLTDAALSRTFAAPSPGQPIDDVERLFPHRYAGLSFAHHRQTLALGASWRARDWLAIGASLTASRVTLSESRRLWAGFAGRDTLGSPTRDITLSLAGTDAFVPGFALGALVAPLDTPVELAASLSASAPSHLSASLTAASANPGSPPTISASSPTASLSLPSPLILRTGARWLSDRWIAELGADLWTYAESDPTWSISGLSIVDDTGASAPVSSLRSQLSRRPHGTIRAALDIEAVPGLAWLTTGYSFTSSSTSTAHLSPAAADLGGHTIALGAELSTDGFTLTLGLARTFSPPTTVSFTDLDLSNPFLAGTAPTGLGTHSQSRTTLALTLDIER